MALNISLRIKLMTGITSLVFISIILISILCYYQFSSFGSSTISVTRKALKKQALNILEDGVKYDWQTVSNLIQTASNDAYRLAISSNTQGYFSALSGKNEILNQIVENGAINTVAGMLNICQLQQNLLGKKLEENIAISEFFFSKGKIEKTEFFQEWNAVNSITGQRFRIKLPVLTTGLNTLCGNIYSSGEKSVPGILEKLSGVSCTIFQKTNEQWDMMSISSSIKDKDGKYLKGFYIPGIDKNGQTSPMIESIQKGEIYQGRFYIMDEWYIGAYKLFKKKDGSAAGMIFTGMREQDIVFLKNSILNIKIGKTGYAAVMDSQGVLVIHPRQDMVNINVIRDLNIKEFQKILDNYKIRKTGIISYIFEKRKKFLAYTYFEPWDWIILGTGYSDEFSQKDTARQFLKNEIKAIFDNAKNNIHAGEETVYKRIICLSENRYDSITLNLDGFSGEPVSIRDYFTQDVISKLKAGNTVFSEIINSSGKNLLIIAAPVLSGNDFRGAIAIEFNWSLLWNVLKKRIYGETGYTYIINDKGVLISHPKYNFQDGVNIGDSEYGELADLVNEKMRKGESGHGIYTFEGIRKYVSFLPLPFGDKIYSIAVTSPVDEFLSLAETIDNKAEASFTEGIKDIGIAAVFLMISSFFLAFFIGSKITKPLTSIIEKLSHSSAYVINTTDRLALASHQLADGASKQAASLEQTSASLEEIAAATQQNAENADRTNKFMQSAREIADRAMLSMNQLVESMNRISKTGEETSKIIKNSDEISFQTNLLALNASIEAARAGESGAGFAIVADEVRMLAMRAAESSQNTSELIETIIRELNESTELVDISSNAFKEVVFSSLEVGKLLEEITFASDEQAKSIEHLNTAVARMDKVTQHNAASASDSAFEFDKIRSHTDIMKEIVNELIRLVYGRRR